MKLVIVGLLALGLIAAGCVALLVGAFQTISKATEDSDQIQFLVAKKDLDIGDVLTIDNVAGLKADVKNRQLPEGFLRDTYEAVGKVLGVKVEEGQVLTSSMFITENASLFSYKIPEGKQAITFSVSQNSLVKTLIYPGSFINIFCSFKIRGSGREEEAISGVILQAVPVIAVEEEFVDKKNEKNSSDSSKGKSNNIRVTLALDSAQVQNLQLALESGSILLTLRNPNDKTIVEVEPTTLDQIKFRGNPLDFNNELLLGIGSSDRKETNVENGPGLITIIRGAKTEVVSIEKTE